LQVYGERIALALIECVDSILKITGQVQLLENDPVVKRTIEARLPFVEALNLLQAQVLKRYRSPEGAGDQTLQDALVVTIQGVAFGMGNTG
jgi:phosphoenolpyruvate carboxylase